MTIGAPAAHPTVLGTSHPPGPWGFRRDGVRATMPGMWNELRAERVRREVVGMCREQRSTTDLLTGVIGAVTTAVPVEATCWSTFDPATTLLTGSVGVDLDDDPAAFERFLRFEYVGAGVDRFRALAASGTTTAVLTQDAEHDSLRAERARDHLAPMGVVHELRYVVGDGSGCWAGAALFRGVGSPEFAPEERALLELLAPTIAAGVRASLLRAPGAAVDVLAGVDPDDVAALVLEVAPDAADGPAVLVLERGVLVEATPAARRWLTELSPLDSGAAGLPSSVHAVAVVAETGVATTHRIRTVRGTWVVVRGAPLGGGRTVVTIERAGPPEVVSLITAALGLTPRERDVVEVVLRGLPTKEIARALHLSPYTVQDHLKTVFAKAGVTSRRQLVAEVFSSYYAPRLGEQRGAGGYFASPTP
jgi:DNA-binding CsgD family transcriptional regulator